MPTFDLTKLLNPKFWLYLVLLAALCWCGYQGYNWIHDRGYNKKADEVKEQIETLTTERNTAVRRYNEYKGTYDNWVANTKNAQEQYILDQEQRLKDTEARLQAALEDAKNKPVTIKEVIKYVPAQVDANFPLPVGLIRLYRDSIQGRGTAGVDPGTDVPQSNFFDVGETSRISVSQFGQITAQNNAECVVRGKVINEWQSWYIANEADFLKFQDWQKANKPRPAKE